MNWFWIALASAVFSAGAAVTQKRVLRDTDPLSFSLVVSGITAVLSLAFLPQLNPESIKTSSMLILFGKSVMNALAFLCIMTALKHLDISRALPVMAVSPMIIALLAFLILGESLTLAETAGIFLISAGTYALELKKGEDATYPLRVLAGSKYHKYLFAALALISLSSVIDKALLTNFKMPPVTFLIFQNFFFFIIFTVIFLFRREKGSFGFLRNRNLLILLLVIAALTVLYRWTQIEATKIAPVGLVISVKRLSVLFASIAGSRLFKEENFTRRIIATCLIVGGAMMILRD